MHLATLFIVAGAGKPAEPVASAMDSRASDGHEVHVATPEYDLTFEDK